MLVGLACVDAIVALALALAPAPLDETSVVRGSVPEEEERPLYGPEPPPAVDAPGEDAPIDAPPDEARSEDSQIEQDEQPAAEGERTVARAFTVDPFAVDGPAREEPRPDDGSTVGAPAAPMNAPRRYRGTGLLVFAGIFGAGAFATKVAITALAIPSISDNTEDCVEACGASGWLITGGLAYTPAFVVSLFLLGGGMGMRGRWRADAERLDLDRPARRFPVRPAVGWGLLGSGVGVWVVTRMVGGLATGSDAANFAWWDGGYYASLALTIPGVMLGAFGTGYLDRQKQLVAITPSIAAAWRGVVATARF